MFYTLTLWMLFTAPALTLAQEAPPVAAQPPAKSSAPTAAEPFADDRRAALDAESQWQEANEALKSRLAELPPCGPERDQAIQQVRDLAFNALARKADYYKKYRDLLGNELRTYQKSGADLDSFRAELQSMASSAEESLADLQRRKAELQQSAKADGASADAALKQLDDLISSTEGRLENLRRSFAQADEADRHTKDSRRVVQSLSESIRHAQLLLDAESALWDAYYRALEARVDFDCALKHRDGFRRFETRRP
jgi:chromosome segregation ATPase